MHTEKYFKLLGSLSQIITDFLGTSSAFISLPYISSTSRAYPGEALVTALYDD